MRAEVELVDFGDEAAWLELFLEFPAALHAADGNWVPDPGERRWLTAVSRRNFLALEAGQVRGRLSVMVNPGLCDSAGRPYGQIGFFDCVDDAATAGRLAGAALDWLCAHEPTVTTVLAPLNFDTWHAYRLRTSGFEQPTFLMEPWNPRYYPELFAALGFQPAAQYVTKSVDAPADLAAAWKSYHRQAVQAGYTFRSFDPACAAEEIALIYRLSLEIFRDNLLFAGISEHEFRALYAGAVGKLDLDLLVFVLDRDGLPAGFAFAVLDHRFPDTANIKTMGVLPRLNGRGVGAALACEIYSRFAGRGVRRVNHCLMRRGNRADQFDRGLAEVTREYALYSRPLKP